MPRDLPQPPDAIRVRGARQNNLKNLDIDIPAGQLTVVTGVSGSGKSSLVFDTVYAEGQRRYVETFSPYARQFLDRMDKPQVDRIEGIPPAIAIDQTNPVRTSRSTVGTMTELNDHLKLLFARMTHLHCRRCGQAVQRDTPPSILASLKARVADVDDPRLAITFPVNVPENFTEGEIEGFLATQGYTRVQARDGDTLHVVQDRLRVGTADDARASEALEAALTRGNGRLAVHVLDGEQPPVWHYSTDLHCADCDIHYADPTPSTFSFNSPLGACETCRGFGRVIGVDLGLVIPDESKTLAQGAIKPWQTESFKECQDDLTRYAAAAEVAMDIPWRDLPEAHRRWVIDGDPKFKSWSAHGGSRWYGVLRFFDWLESKAYKMHVRVLLSRYRAYTPCEACGGARLQPDALDFRLGQQPEADAVLAPEKRFRPTHVAYGRKTLETLPGLTIHDLMLLPIDRLGTFFERLDLPKPLDEASELVLGEINSRLRYLQAVGLGYLTLDRQSRTLSGGEVQRINLTTALGTSLVNTLFVLDEPSIGLHPRDMDRVVGVMQRLRAQGNTLLVVEHDPQIMVAADRLVDMGPGPGERGGQIIYEGAPQNIGEARHSLTADYLLGRRHVATARQPQPPDADTAHLSLRGVRANNLKDISLELPLNRLLCITGVSGSGKSTLVQDVLYPGLCKALGKPTETPGEHDALSGSEAIRDVVMVDQSAIGRSSRSNPASYVGAFDAVRTLFGRLEAAKERGFTAGTFSFNAGKGRCPSCGGSGFEHVEMQFLSDVYLRCPDCDGRRYRDAVLEVRLNERSIADVLEMTVAEAVTFFTPLTGGKAVVDALQPLIDVGLDYLALGQPVPTLSGGEAQRLKLAGHLVEAAARRRKRVARNDGGSTLFLFDEPTTGLHFQDINRLLGAFAKLLEGGDSLLVIEHNLDVIAASDWVIDLGPEGGDGGGRIVATGTPETIMACAQSHTGRALCAYRDSLASLELPKAAEPAVAFDARPTAIEIRHAREHNLKNINVAIPHGGFTVVTGPSGSGKSTLAFDIVFNEGQRRYLESLNAYARQFVQPAARPDVDAIWGIPPTVAIEQRISRGGRKSTVATLTEIYPFLRLLWMKLGVQYCPGCQVPIQPQTADSIAERIARDFKNQAVTVLAPMVVNRKGLYTELAKWARGKGYEQLRVDGEFRPVKPFKRLDRFKEHNIELPVARFTVTSRNGTELGDALTTALTLGKGVVQVLAEGAGQATVFSTKRACPSCGASFPEPDPRLFSFNSKHGWCESCQGTGVAVSGYQQDERVSEEVADKAMDAWLDARGDDAPCPACHGARLNPVARNVLFRDLSLPALTAQPVHAVRRFMAGLTLQAREVDIARDIVSEIDGRLSFLDQVGLAYLSLDRGAPTLSGGEAQRIRLAAQLGSNLQGVVYVLDEPTIGLHPRDNRILLDALELLEAKGNTLLVVEHDEDTIRRAHHVIDLGPGAGRLGGQIVAQGTAAELAANPTQSLTGRFLAEPLRHPLQPRRPINKKTPSVDVVAAHRHNLKDVHARFPLGRLTVVTGVSGSGKSTLARDVLLTNLYTQVNLKRGSERPPLTGCLALRGWEQVGRVLEVDQTPIGKTPRSCPATYVGFWDAIRKRFAETQDARIRGWEPGRFSFNTKGGRCEVCEGQGMVRVEMNFLPDVKLPCEACGGRRFNRETAGLSWRGQSVADVLAMSVDEAVEFFTAHPSIHHALKLLQDVGLGYLTLGQPSPTLSGGEAQRIKLVTELSKVRTDANAPPRRGANKGQTLYVLDEPTVGLHMADVEKLIRVLHRLVDAGNTVVLIEHNLDLIAEADWIVDLGPEGGDGGGEIVVQGPPEAVIALAEHSHTGAVLAEFMHGREALTV